MQIMISLRLSLAQLSPSLFVYSAYAQATASLYLVMSVTQWKVIMQYILRLSNKYASRYASHLQVIVHVIRSAIFKVTMKVY